MYIRSSQELSDTLSVTEAQGDPLATFCSAFYPKSREEAFQLAEFAWNHIPMYRSGLERMISYFITKIQLSGASGDEKTYWENLLLKKSNMHTKLKLIGEDYQNYGNSFTSLLFPFVRLLRCTECHTEINGSRADYRIEDGEFIWKCLKCGYEGPVEVNDRLQTDPKEIYVIRWNPYEIELENYDPLREEADYYWRIPDHVRKQVRDGGPLLSTMPKSIVLAAARDEDLKFKKGSMMHLKFEGLAGTKNQAQGWGVPPILSIFSDLWFRQLINRFDQAVALDYLFPMRVITPANRSQGRNQAQGMYEDPGLQGGTDVMNAITARLEDMVASHREDPKSWHVSPIPLHYGPMGGEGTQLLQPEIGEYADSKLLNGMGSPMEFYEGNLQWQATPEAMRVMERMWGHLPTAMNTWLDWAVSKASVALARKEIVAELTPSSIKDDLMRREIMLQLFQQGELAKLTAFEPWHIPFEEDKDNQIQEIRDRVELEKRKDRELTAEERAYMLGRPQPPPQEGGVPPGGAPPAGGTEGGGMGGTMPMSGGGDIQQMSLEAEQIAQQMLQMEPPVRRSELIQLKRQNETLHALVTAKIREMRGEVDQQGAMQSRQQQFGTV